MQWNKGDILESNHKDAIHPIVFLKNHDHFFFIGAMITSKGPKKYQDNVAMQKSHFVELDEKAKRYKITYGPSYFVNAKLLKKLEWQPFRKVGKLTDVGISFLETQIQEKDPATWEDYLQNK